MSVSLMKEYTTVQKEKEVELSLYMYNFDSQHIFMSICELLIC